jgi:hypothetical protein
MSLQIVHERYERKSRGRVIVSYPLKNATFTNTCKTKQSIAW